VSRRAGGGDREEALSGLDAGKERSPVCVEVESPLPDEIPTLPSPGDHRSSRRVAAHFAPCRVRVPGVPVSVYHDNVVLTETPDRYLFQFSCAVGANEIRRWTVRATDQEADHASSVTVKDTAGKFLERGRTMVRISPQDSARARACPALIVGDSLTHATHYPNELALLLTGPGNPKTILIGQSPA